MTDRHTAFVTGRGHARLFVIIMLCILFIAATASTALSATAKEQADYKKAVSLYNKGKYKEAIPLFKKYIETNQDPKVYYMLAYSLYKIGENEESRQYFQYAYANKPEYSPTPELEKKLNHRLKPARPGPGDEKRAVPLGELPPEVRDLDPEQYRIIDKSERLKVPGETESTDNFQPSPARKRTPSRRPAAATKPAPTTKPAPVTKPAPAAKPVPPMEGRQAPAAPAEKKPVTVAKTTEMKPTADKPQEAAAPAPQPTQPQSVAQQPSGQAAEAPQPARPPVATGGQPARQPAAMPRHAQQAGSEDRIAEIRTKVEQYIQPLIEQYGPMLESSMAKIALGVFALAYLLFWLPVYIAAKKLNVSAPILSFIPILQFWKLSAAAGLSWIWGLIFLLLWPTYIILIYPVMLISARLGKGKLLGFLLFFFLGQIGMLLLVIIGGGTGKAAKARPGDSLSDLSGEPELDLPDVDDMGFDSGDDFASDSGFGSDEGMGGHTDDFGMAGSESGGEFDLGGGFDDSAFDSDDKDKDDLGF